MGPMLACSPPLWVHLLPQGSELLVQRLPEGFDLLLGLGSVRGTHPVRRRGIVLGLHLGQEGRLPLLLAPRAQQPHARPPFRRDTAAGRARSRWAYFASRRSHSSAAWMSSALIELRRPAASIRSASCRSSGTCRRFTVAIGRFLLPPPRLMYQVMPVRQVLPRRLPVGQPLARPGQAAYHPRAPMAEPYATPRRFPRVKMLGNVTGEVSFLQDVTLLDLSEGGARLEHAGRFALNAICFLRVPVPEGDLLKAWVVHSAVSRTVPGTGGEPTLLFQSGVEFVGLTLATLLPLRQFLASVDRPPGPA